MPFSVNLSVSPSAPLVKIYLYMWNRQGVHKFHWISSCLCNHDDILLYLYWHICPCCVSKYIWWEAISYFESWNIFLSNKMSHCCLGCSGNSDVGEICLHVVVRIPQAHKIAKVEPPLLSCNEWHLLSDSIRSIYMVLYVLNLCGSKCSQSKLDFVYM